MKCVYLLYGCLLVNLENDAADVPESRPHRYLCLSSWAYLCWMNRGFIVNDAHRKWVNLISEPSLKDLKSVVQFYSSICRVELGALTCTALGNRQEDASYDWGHELWIGDVEIKALNFMNKRYVRKENIKSVKSPSALREHSTPSNQLQIHNWSVLYLCKFESLTVLLQAFSWFQILSGHGLFCWVVNKGFYINIHVAFQVEVGWQKDFEGPPDQELSR